MTGLDFLKPVRRIGMNHRSLTGRAVVRGQSVPFESSLERDFLILMDFDPRVAAVREQPMTIPFRAASGLQSHYTPDFLVLYKDQTASLHEIKYRDELRANWEELRPRFRAAFRHARVSGMRFSIQTEVKIRSPKLNNIKFLRPYARQEPNTEVEGHLITALGRIGESSVRDLIAAVRSAPEGQSQVLPHVWRLLALHRIHAELSVPLTMDTALTVSRSA